MRGRNVNIRIHVPRHRGRDEDDPVPRQAGFACVNTRPVGNYHGSEKTLAGNPAGWEYYGRSRLKRTPGWATDAGGVTDSRTAPTVFTDGSPNAYFPIVK